MKVLLAFFFVCFLIGMIPSRTLWEKRVWVIGALCILVSASYYYLEWM